jgi:hypothetical protein
MYISDPVDDSYCCEYLAIFVGVNHSIIVQAFHQVEKIVLFCAASFRFVFASILLVQTAVSGCIVHRTRTNLVL